jgi:hypothetical protein
MRKKLNISLQNGLTNQNPPLALPASSHIPLVWHSRTEVVTSGLYGSTFYISISNRYLQVITWLKVENSKPETVFFQFFALPVFLVGKSIFLSLGLIMHLSKLNCRFVDNFYTVVAALFHAPFTVDKGPC